MYRLDLLFKMILYIAVVYLNYVFSSVDCSDIILKSYNVDDKQLSLFDNVGTLNQVVFGNLNATATCDVGNRCFNGGLCYNNVCICLPGTSGPFCADIDGCGDLSCKKDKNAVCDYDQRNFKAYCKCKPFGQIFDYDENVCKECMCGNCINEKRCTGAEKCEFIRGQKTCTCSLPYFKYNPKKKICEVCTCGDNSRSCYFDDDGKQKCKCEYGYSQRGGFCEECECYGALDCKFVNYNAVCNCGSGKEQSGMFCYSCTCGEKGRCIWSDWGHGQVGCKCDPGYIEINGVCKALESCYCGKNSNCTIKDDQKICSCQDGYRNVNGLCTDINECDNPKTCPKYMQCLNLIGSYNCTCINGFRSSTKIDGGCEDIDECLESKPCVSSEQECFNTVGSFRCVCKPGYSARDGIARENPMCENKSSWKLGLGLFTGIFLAIMIALIIVINRKS